jgi:arylsulfatase A-like enzyme
MYKSKPNIVLIGIDSLLAEHMSCYSYHRLTTPYIDRFAQSGTLFEQTYSAHIPTTSAYASMLTGLDCFSTQVVALRHKGGLRTDMKTLPEILKEEGYNTSCVGFTGNPSSRGFDTYLDCVLRHLPAKRQTLFFSATMPAPIIALTREMLHNPAMINLERRSAP